MRESRTYGSVRGAPRDERPYRVYCSSCAQFSAVHESGFGTKLSRAYATTCPQLAEADMRALTRS
jgi:hypothetical protein